MHFYSRNKYALSSQLNNLRLFAMRIINQVQANTVALHDELNKFKLRKAKGYAYHKTKNDKSKG